MQEDIDNAANCRADCFYRRVLRGENIYYCNYILEEGHSRGCPVSKCDKYRTGKRIRPKMMPQVYIEWESEIYERTTDNFDGSRFIDGEWR